jgi:Na+-transporting methylmalonyl-CoA/oxaloacetate decarboxylase gamma subunit
MPDNLALALQLTLIGMSLVFGAILVFWGLMTALVRVAADGERRAGPDAGQALKQQAAALAVAVALAEAARPAADQPNVPPLPATAMVSAWQAVMRANQLGQRGPVR